MSLKPFTIAFRNVWEGLTEGRAWNYLFANEKTELALFVLEKMETAYDEAFASCEGQDSGFAGTTAWTNGNPYRKDPEILDILAKLRRDQ